MYFQKAALQLYVCSPRSILDNVLYTTRVHRVSVSLDIIMCCYTSNNSITSLLTV